MFADTDLIRFNVKPNTQTRTPTTEPQEAEKNDAPPITEEIIETIIHINKLITLNELERAEKND